MGSGSGSAADTAAAAADDDDDGDDDDDDDTDDDEVDDPVEETSDIASAVAIIAIARAREASTTGVAVTLRAVARPGRGRAASELPDVELDVGALIHAIGVKVSTAVDSGKALGGIEAVGAVDASALGVGDAAADTSAEEEGGKRVVETGTTTKTDIAILAARGGHAELEAPVDSIAVVTEGLGGVNREVEVSGASSGGAESEGCKSSEDDEDLHHFPKR
jgi:hypothetical protein